MITVPSFWLWEQRSAVTERRPVRTRADIAQMEEGSSEGTHVRVDWTGPDWFCGKSIRRRRGPKA